MDKKKWEGIKKKLQRLILRRRISTLRRLLKKEKNKKIREEIESELTKALSNIPAPRRIPVLIASEASSIETTAAEGRDRGIRPELLRSLENILLSTPTPPQLEEEKKNYGPSFKYGLGSYQTFKYEDMGAKYEPPKDIKLRDALVPPVEYKSLAETSPMLEKLPELKKLETSEEDSLYKRKKKESS
ncbi:MAG: hypothetical protein AABY07_10330 [Nanoarchaeota archaeon]